MTEPSGQGEYAEAMRELIAELPRGVRRPDAGRPRAPRPVPRDCHLRLVR